MSYVGHSSEKTKGRVLDSIVENMKNDKTKKSSYYRKSRTLFCLEMELLMHKNVLIIQVISKSSAVPTRTSGEIKESLFESKINCAAQSVPLKLFE